MSLTPNRCVHILLFPDQRHLNHGQGGVRGLRQDYLQTEFGCSSDWPSTQYQPPSRCWQHGMGIFESAMAEVNCVLHSSSFCFLMACLWNQFAFQNQTTINLWLPRVSFPLCSLRSFLLCSLLLCCCDRKRPAQRESRPSIVCAPLSPTRVNPLARGITWPTCGSATAGSTSTTAKSQSPSTRRSALATSTSSSACAKPQASQRAHTHVRVPGI